MVEEHMDMVYVDIMSNREIRFGNRRYVRYLTAFQDFTKLVFAVFLRDMDALSDVCSQVHTRAKIANDDDSYQCKVLKDYYKTHKEIVNFRRHTVLKQGSLINRQAIFNRQKRMLKLISGLVNVAFELAFELQYYNDKDRQRPFHSHLKEHIKDEIIHGNFRFAGKEFIRYIRAIALVAHQCYMYKLKTCGLDIMLEYHISCFPDIYDSFASAYEVLNEVEEADKAIIDQMGKLMRIVSEYDYIKTVNYEESFITFLIYNYTESSIFVDF
ncbi:MAG: hypothetical protein ACTTIV_07305 [Campylobacter sp.]